MNNQEKYTKEVIAGFQSNRGKASVYCFAPIKYGEVIASIIYTFYTKRPNSKVLIITGNFKIRQAVMAALKKDDIDEANGFYIKAMSADYIKPQYQYNYSLIITIGVNENIEIINHLYKGAKFMLSMFTENLMNRDFISNIRSILPNINTTVSANSIRNDNIYSPVEEYRVGITLSDEDRLLYDKYAEYINTSISIFGDISNIEKCKYGDPNLNISAADIRNDIARGNGWSEELDTTIDFHRTIDENYNPNALYERACTFYNITKQRKDLLTDNSAKLAKIAELCDEHRDRQILIVSKRGEFAAAITKYLNENTDLACGNYHDCIESSMIYDSVTKQPILIKSGAKKGQPKIVGAQAISTLNMSHFNNSEMQVLSIKNSSSNKLKIRVDLVIITSPYCDGIIDIKTRFTDVVITGIPNKVFKLYCVGTTENVKLSNEKQTPIISVIDDNENIIGYDENSGDVIL